MRNRAKCKKCGTIIESFHATDYVTCSCGEIFVDQGKSMRCGAGSWDNFLRVDDKDNLVPITVKTALNKDDVKPLYNDENSNVKPTKEEVIQMLDNMISDMEKLPEKALYQPVTHYDLMSALILLSAALKS